MKYSLLAGRAIIFSLAFYTFFFVDPIVGAIFVVFGLFSFVFGMRHTLLIKPSREADYWELFGIALVLANNLIIAFADFNDPSYAWLDIPLHAWGGAFGAWWASLAFGQEFKSLKVQEFKGLKSLIVILGVTALIGVGWEFFEWGFDNSIGAWYDLPIAQPSVNDTMGDFVFDLLGGLAVWLVYKKSEGKR